MELNPVINQVKLEIDTFLEPPERMTSLPKYGFNLVKLSAEDHTVSQLLTDRTVT